MVETLNLSQLFLGLRLRTLPGRIQTPSATALREVCRKFPASGWPCPPCTSPALNKAQTGWERNSLAKGQLWLVQGKRPSWSRWCLEQLLLSKAISIVLNK